MKGSIDIISLGIYGFLPIIGPIVYTILKNNFFFESTNQSKSFIISFVLSHFFPLIIIRNYGRGNYEISGEYGGRGKISYRLETIVGQYVVVRYREVDLKNNL